MSYPLVFLLSRLAGRRQDASFVVFQTAKIGDMICTTPVFREIKRAYPGSRLGVVITPLTRPLLKHNPHIDEIIEFDARRCHGVTGKLRFALGLRRSGYNRALILAPNAANILAAFWAALPQRVCIYPDVAGGTLKLLLGLNTHLERHVRGRMTMETFLRALRFFGIDDYRTDKEVYAPIDAGVKAAAYLKGAGPFVGVVAGSANAMKDWGLERFKALSKRLLKETDAVIVVLGSEKERPAGEELRGAGAEAERVINACGEFTLEEAPALLKRLSVVIGVDTALIYMADALNVPVVDIAGPCDMNDQRPVGKRAVILQRREGLACVPCSHTFKAPYECREGHRRCAAGVSVEEVFSAVAAVFKRAG